jgi:hypothetical protein
VPEVAVCGAGREHYRVVGRLPFALQRDSPGSQVNHAYPAQQDRPSRLPAQNAPDRLSDLFGGQHRGRGWYKKRLNSWWVTAADQITRMPLACPEPLSCREAAKAASDDQDMCSRLTRALGRCGGEREVRLSRASPAVGGQRAVLHLVEPDLLYGRSRSSGGAGDLRMGVIPTRAGAA